MERRFTTFAIVKQAYIEGWQAYTEGGLWRSALWIFLIYTVVCGIVLFVVALKGAFWLATTLPELLVPEEGSWLRFFLGVASWFFAIFFVLVVSQTIYRTGALFVLSFFLGSWTERVDPVRPPTGFRMLRVFWSTLWTALWLTVLEWVFAVVGFVVTYFLPGPGLMALPLMLIVECYLWGAAMCDYALERRGYTFSGRRRFWRAHRKALILLGASAVLSFLILPIPMLFIGLPVSALSATRYVVHVHTSTT